MGRPRKPLPWWQIILIRKKGVPLGRVQARNATEAIEIAIEQWGITGERQERLAATRIDEA